ncbi:MAG: hypothetical protein J5892_04840 [Bacilli bacterium]|nr:hypothetical protein [Bacilli bacterium]
MNYYREDNRFIIPFLVGAVTGGAAIGLTRPRPIVSTGYYPVNTMPNAYSYGYNYYYRPY